MCFVLSLHFLQGQGEGKRELVKKDKKKITKERKEGRGEKERKKERKTNQYSKPNYESQILYDLNPTIVHFGEDPSLLHTLLMTPIPFVSHFLLRRGQSDWQKHL